MVERLVRDLAIEEVLQEEIKDTLERNNQSYGEWCSQTDTKKITTRLNLLLHMIWDGRRDHLVGDMTPLAGMPSSLAEEEKWSSECYSMPRPSRSVMLYKREDNKHKNTSAQITSREAQKVWRLLQF